MNNYNQNKIKTLTELIEKLQIVIDAELAKNNFEAVAEFKAMIARWEARIEAAKQEV